MSVWLFFTFLPTYLPVVVVDRKRMSSPARPAAFVVARALEGISVYLLAGARARGVGVELRRAIFSRMCPLALPNE